MPLEIIDSGTLPPDRVMEKDKAILDGLNSKSSPLLHFYDWSAPCLTYGYFINQEDYLNLEQMKIEGLLSARRPTGGGISLHLTDFAFSILIPAHSPDFSTNTLDNYALINKKIGKIIAEFSAGYSSDNKNEPTLLTKTQSNIPFCMAQPTQYDLMVNGKKVGGAAERKTKQGLLHQGTISLSFPPRQLVTKIVKDPSIVKLMEENSYTLLPSHASGEELNTARTLLRDLFTHMLFFS